MTCGAVKSGVIPSWHTGANLPKQISMLAGFGTPRDADGAFVGPGSGASRDAGGATRLANGG